MPPERFPIPQGTLTCSSCRSCPSARPRLRHRPAHRADPRNAVQVNQGSLYPALHRLEQKKWLRSGWRASETGREAKFYALTRAGEKQLAIEKDSWDRLDAAVRLIFAQGE
jgi:predicted ArsR family transcriptional regulator